MTSRHRRPVPNCPRHDRRRRLPETPLALASGQRMVVDARTSKPGRLRLHVLTANH